MNRGMPVLVLVLSTWNALTVLSGQEQPAALEAQTLAELKSVDMSAEQVAHIKKLAAEFGPQISQAEKSAARTPAQRKSRDEAIKKAIAEGKKGIEARVIIAAAGALTEEQKAAAKKAAKTRSAFERALLALLTEEQQTRLKAQSDPGRIGDGDQGQSEYSGFIIVRLSPQLPDASDQSHTLADVAKELKLTGLQEVFVDFNLTVSRRVVPDLSLAAARAPQQSATKSKLLRRLRSYWRVDVRENDVRIDAILTRLNKLPEVDLAYRELTVSEPIGTPSDDPYNNRQGYLDSAPTGVDARFAWTQSNGKGAGIGFVDLERGWYEDHEDFTLKTPLMVYGDNRISSAPHGTAVLGEVIADDNALGVVGIAPSVSYVFLTSYYNAVVNTSADVAAAIYNVLPLLTAGDVLLLEVERGRSRPLPTEVDDADFDAIQLAVFEGINVVEAAGNGGNDLDAYVNSLGRKTLRRGSADFRDSGAILVGGADSNAVHNRAAWSNFGSRVDCYGWGRNVTSTGHNGDLDNGGGDNNKKYTKSFNGTSSAAPIIAGAAIILQAMSQANSGSRVSPSLMRAMLANPLTGTPQGPDVSGNIGVMPDLRAIIELNGAFCPPPPDPRYCPQRACGCRRLFFHLRARKA